MVNFAFSHTLPARVGRIERFTLSPFGKLAEQVGSPAGGAHSIGARDRLGLEFDGSEAGLDEDGVNRVSNTIRSCFQGGFGAGVRVGVLYKVADIE